MLRAEWLEAFIAFAERLNFTHAAKTLHLSQPALFVQISKLGEALGVPLYTKQGRQLGLTDAGRRLLAFAREQRDRDGEVVSELRTGRSRATVTLAAGTGSFLYILGPALREFLRLSPARLRLLQRERPGTVEAVKSGEAQLGVAAFDAIPDELEPQLLTRVPQLVVMPRQHALANRRRLKLRDLEGLSLIVPPVGQPQRATLEQALSSAGVRWQPAVEATGWTLVLRFVELGLGLTVVNGCCEIPRGLVARPLGELPAVSYYLVSRQGATPGVETRRLRNLILELTKR